VVALAVLAGVAQTQGDELLQGFQNPPDSAKPRVWWHWMSGNVTKDGIGATTKYTYTAQQFYRADSPLLPSGLIGPVQVVRSVSK
jgi:hypothetical protein